MIDVDPSIDTDMSESMRDPCYLLRMEMARLDRLLVASWQDDDLDWHLDRERSRTRRILKKLLPHVCDPEQ